MNSNTFRILVVIVFPMIFFFFFQVIAGDKVWKREVKTMEEQCDVKKGLATKGGLISNPKGMQGPKAPYAEGSFSSSTYRENSDLRRKHEEAFGISTNGFNTNLVNVVTNKVK